MNEVTQGTNTRWTFHAGWIGLALVVLIAAFGVAVAKARVIRSQREFLLRQTSRGEPVLVTQLIGGSQSREIMLPGEVHGYYETPIYAKIDGYITTMLVDKGSRVRAGQLVATIESPETDQQTRNAKATYDLAAITDWRNQQLVKEQVIPQQTADQSHDQMREAYATWRQDVATQQYERVLAPYDGMITVRNLNPGALVGSGSASNTSTPAIYEMATLKPLRVYVYLPQPLSPFMRDGDEAVVAVGEYPDRIFVGRVTRHPQALDQNTRTMQIEVDLPNDDLVLYPGMYATIKITIHGSKQSPKVPDQALIFNNNDTFVPVVQDSRIHLVEVTLGLDDGTDCEVTHGLSGDETVALGMGQTAHEGELVQPVSFKSN